jgi:hypothetical protein
MHVVSHIGELLRSGVVDAALAFVRRIAHVLEACTDLFQQCLCMYPSVTS